MSLVGGFVHLYHIWGLWGLITAIIYGRSAYIGWSKAGGKWRHVPFQIVGSALRGVGSALSDWLRFLRWFLAGLIGIALKRDSLGFPEIDLYFPEPEQSKWPRNQTLLLGITLGGAARLATALYWAEKNTSWMTEATVLVPAIPIAMAVMADANHQFTAWQKRPWIARMLLVLAFAWVCVGMASGGLW